MKATSKVSKKVKWWFWECPPIDWWVGWTSLSRVETTEGDYSADLLSASWARYHLPIFMEQFRAMGWEGDGQWWITAIPDPENPPGTALVVAVKQGNNGTTFIASSFPMPWIQSDSLARLFLDQVD